MFGLYRIPPRLACAVLFTGASINALAGNLATGEHEIVSKRFDAPIVSSGIDGNSQVEDVSLDGRYIVYNTEGSYTTASRGSAKSMIYDRDTGTVELFEPNPLWHSSNLMLHDNPRYATFISTSPLASFTFTPPSFSPDPGESLEAFGDLFTWDRETDTYIRLTTGLNIPILKEREITMSKDGERIVFFTSSFRTRNDFTRLPLGYYLFERSSNSITELFPVPSTSRTLSTPILSGAGTWMAYRSNPFSADSFVAFRNLDTNAEVTFDTTSTQLLSLNFTGERLLYTDEVNGERTLYEYNRTTQTRTLFLPEANAAITNAVYSGNGQFIFFETTATNLVTEPDPSGGTPDMYRLNVSTGAITRLTRLKPGGISPHSVNFDGSVVAFEDDANIFDAADPNGGYSDVFAWDASGAEIVRASNTVEPYTLTGANDDSSRGVLSASGRFVAFISQGTNLLASEDTNDVTDLFFHDRVTEETRNLTANSNAFVSQFAMSASGQELVFLSTGDNLGSGQVGVGTNLYLYEAATDQITNLTATLRAANNNEPISSLNPSLSADGNRVLFGATVGSRVWDRTTNQLFRISSGNVTSGALNADGSIAMLEEVIRNNRTIELYNVDTQQLIDSSAARVNTVRSPRMSDDASRIIFNSFDDLIPDNGQIERGLYLWERSTNTYRFLNSALSTNFSYDISRDGSIAVLQRRNNCDNSNGSKIFFLNEPSEQLLGCVLEDPGQNNVVTRPSLSANGDLVLGETQSRYLKTDVSYRNSVFVQRLSSTVDNTNTPPTVVDLEVTTTEGRAAGVTLTGSDSEDDELTYIVDVQPTNGRLSGTPPQLVYTPNTDHTGTDSFTYRASDGQSSSNAALVSITIAPETTLSFTAVQRPGSRTIDLNATWPAEAHWTQVRVFDDLSSVLWDGQALQWSGSYTPAPGITSVTFNSRYFIAGVVMGNTDLTVTLADPAAGFTLTGFAWIDSNADAIRDLSEAGDVGREVALFRCEAPYGLVGNATSVAPDGQFTFSALEAGMYQIGTSPAGVEFSAPNNDNVVFTNGFSNCITVDGTQREIGIGLLSGDLPTITVNGFAWRDSNADSLRDFDEEGDVERTVTMFRCNAPYGIAGTAQTNAQGNFEIAGVPPGEYQFGTTAAGVNFSPVRRDNLVFANGFSNCVDFATNPRNIGIGILE